jgi:hypothetical protein
VGLGYSGLDATLHSAPPYLVACGFLWITSFLADHIHRRLPIIIVQASIGITGLALMSQIQLGPQARYAGMCLAVAACQSNNSAIIIFGQNNTVGSAKTNLAAVLNIAGGTIGGIVGSTVYMGKEAPSYTTGLSITMALQACLLLSCAAVWLVNVRGNRKADNGEVVLNGVQGWRWTL